MKNIFTVLFCFALFLVGTGARAQDGRVRGFIYDKETDQPIPFANISLEGTSYGAVANEDGYFIISNIPPGSYTLAISFVGYTRQTKPIVVEVGKIPTEKIYMEQASEILQDVEINAERQERETQVLTGVVNLNPKEIRQFSVGGDADVVKALQVLPGVITTGDQGGQLYIRGGAPIQNLILLDGMIVYNPFHSIGFFSVFDVDIIQNVEVYTGGFNAEYGSRNSAVMDVETRDPNRRRFSGKVSASTYSSKLLLETPLGRKDENGQAASSFLITGKTSYLNQTSSIFYPYVETEFGDLPFSFTDVYGKFNAQSSNGSEVNLFGFSFNDAVRFGGDNHVEWSSVGGGADFTVVPPSSSVLISGDFSYSSYDIVSVERGGTPDESGINGFNGGLDFTYFMRENDELKYGLEAIGYQTTLQLGTENGGVVRQSENTTELGTYLQYKIKANRFILQPGIRLHYYGSLSELSLEPRLGFKLNITENLRFKASGGFYSQNLVAANNDRDVVNLFYGFLSGPEDIPDNFRGEPVDSRLQKAQHLIAGVEVEVSENLTLNLEGYVKNFSQLTNVNRNKIYEEDDFSKPEILRQPYIIEKGLARGIDFLAKYRNRNIYLWLTYSLGKITRDDGITEYPAHFDRRHNLNFVGNYQFGKDRQWEAGLRYNFGTGFPFTPIRGYYNKKPFVNDIDQPQVAYDYTTENGEFSTLYGNLNSKRLPNYHRVDVSISRTFSLSKNKILEVSVGATNILNYENVFYFDAVDIERINQLPIMPTISMSLTF